MTSLRIFEHYNLINAFCSIADSFGMTKPQQRYEEAVKKLGFMSLRYARKMLLNQHYTVAEEYLKLSTIFYPEMKSDIQYKNLRTCLESENPSIAAKQLKLDAVYVRSQSYDPPENSIKILHFE